MGSDLVRDFFSLKSVLAGGKEVDGFSLEEP